MKDKTLLSDPIAWFLLLDIMLKSVNYLNCRYWQVIFISHNQRIMVWSPQHSIQSFQFRPHFFQTSLDISIFKL